MEFMGVIRIISVAVLIALIIWFMLPLVQYGILHIGMIYPSVIFLMIALIIIFPGQTAALFTGRIKPFMWTAVIAAGIFIAVVAAIMCMMASAANNAPPENTTVIVLGCQVRGSTPSKMLSDRMNVAVKYLRENPDAKCIASGGKGAGENISEAQAIKDYLVDAGIDGSRIYIEDKSVNTAQNIEYSAKIMRENGLPDTAAIASDNFHQLRAKIFADNCGIKAYSLGCKTFKPVAAGYWTREVLAVVRAAVLGR